MKNEINVIADFAIEKLEERKEFTFYCFNPCAGGGHNGGGNNGGNCGGGEEPEEPGEGGEGGNG